MSLHSQDSTFSIKEVTMKDIRKGDIIMQGSTKFKVMDIGNISSVHKRRSTVAMRNMDTGTIVNNYYYNDSVILKLIEHKEPTSETAEDKKRKLCGMRSNLLTKLESYEFALDLSPNIETQNKINDIKLEINRINIEINQL